MHLVANRVSPPPYCCHWYSSPSWFFVMRMCALPKNTQEISTTCTCSCVIFSLGHTPKVWLHPYRASCQFVSHVALMKHLKNTGEQNNIYAAHAVQQLALFMINFPLCEIHVSWRGKGSFIKEWRDKRCRRFELSKLQQARGCFYSRLATR